MRIPHKLFSMPYILILILFFIKLMTVVIFLFNIRSKSHNSIKVLY